MLSPKKLLIIGCTLSLIAGLSLVMPIMLYSLSWTNYFPEQYTVYPNPQSTSSQIGVELSYASVGLTTGSIPSGPGEETTIELPMKEGTIELKGTKYVNSNTSIPDAEVDYFLVEIYADNGVLIKEVMYHFGAVYISSYNTSTIWQFTDQAEALLNTSHAGGGFNFMWAPQTSQARGFGFKGTMNSPVQETLQSAEFLTLKLSRIGSATIKDNNITVTTADQGLIAEYKLNKSGDYFIYGKQYVHTLFGDWTI